jgi:hypothetical protein
MRLVYLILGTMFFSAQPTLANAGKCAYECSVSDLAAKRFLAEPQDFSPFGGSTALMNTDCQSSPLTIGASQYRFLIQSDFGNSIQLNVVKDGAWISSEAPETNGDYRLTVDQIEFACTKVSD